MSDEEEFKEAGPGDVFQNITINPSCRMGFVNGPDLTTALQSFSY